MRDSDADTTGGLPDLRVYHRTPHGSLIIEGGFRDGTGSYGRLTDFTGVFVSNVPLDINEGAKGDDLIEVLVLESAIAEYEWIQDMKPYREWCAPAHVLNIFSRRLIGEDEEEEMEEAAYRARFGPATKEWPGPPIGA